MKTFVLGAMGALLVCAPAIGAVGQAAGFTPSAVRLVGDGGGSDSRVTTSVYNGGKEPYDPAQGGVTKQRVTRLDRQRGNAVAVGKQAPANAPDGAKAPPSSSTN